MTNWVGAGSLAPRNSLYMFSKTGMTFASMTTTTTIATSITTLG